MTSLDLLKGDFLQIRIPGDEQSLIKPPFGRILFWNFSQAPFANLRICWNSASLLSGTLSQRYLTLRIHTLPRIEIGLMVEPSHHPIPTIGLFRGNPEILGHIWILIGNMIPFIFVRLGQPCKSLESPTLRM